VSAERNGRWEIYALHADGQWGQITRDFSPARALALSPDGKQHINISRNQFDDEQPVWSPDGKRLAFVSNREGCEQVTDPIALNACQRREIFVANFDGARLSNVQQLTFEGRSNAPAWSPDGKSLV
jgi:hypothetical protein